MEPFLDWQGLFLNTYFSFVVESLDAKLNSKLNYYYLCKVTSGNQELKIQSLFNGLYNPKNYILHMG